MIYILKNVKFVFRSVMRLACVLRTTKSGFNLWQKINTTTYVKQALIDEGWTITDDPYSIDWAPDWQVDLGAERLVAAEKGAERIAVEIKTFKQPSFAYEFHTAMGQYVNYSINIVEQEKGRELYLAVPLDVYKTEFDKKGIKLAVEKVGVKIIIYNKETGKIEKWITTYNQK